MTWLQRKAEEAAAASPDPSLFRAPARSHRPLQPMIVWWSPFGNRYLNRQARRGTPVQTYLRSALVGRGLKPKTQGL